MPVTGTVVNVWASRLIPVILLAILIYVSWVVVSEVSVDFLISPHPEYDGGQRIGAAVAILVFYFVVFVGIIWSFLRVLWAVVHDPGYIRQNIVEEDGQQTNDLENGEKPKPSAQYYLSTLSTIGRSSRSPTIEDFLTRDAFVCDDSGSPKWCNTCNIYRPDRARHCREVNRCVRQMDHFCPWVGGIISETTFKPFLLFNIYTSLYCLIIIIFTSIFVDTLRSRSGLPNGHILAVLVFGLFFLLITSVVGLTAAVLAISNLSTPECVAQAGTCNVVKLAVRLDLQTTLSLQSSRPESTVIAYTTTGQTCHFKDCNAAHIFILLTSDRYANPWDQGSALANWRLAMGRHWWDWFLPVRTGYIARERPSFPPKDERPEVERLEVHRTPFFLPYGPDLEAMKMNWGW